MTNKKNDGLPEIADDKHRKPILMMLGIVLIIVSSMYFFNRTNKKVAQKTIEETFTVQPIEQVEDKKLQPLLASATDSVPSPKISQEVMQQQIALIQEKQKELQQRLTAPIMLVNLSPSTSIIEKEQQAQDVSGDANTHFMNQLSGQKTTSVIATSLGPLNYIIAEGRFIHATLESATNSDLPGFLRATVSYPVYSEDGSQILIPVGSWLLGQYKSAILQGQSRLFIVWTRLITPSGISLKLASPGVDNLGTAGMEADEVNRHFWERFGTASLLSLIGMGAANVGVHSNTQENSASAYRGAIANSFAQSANQSLQQENVIAQTLKKYQGQPIMVFIAQDLNFQEAMQRVRPALNVF